MRIKEALSILKEWGMIHLIQPENNSYLQLLIHEYGEIIKAEISQEEINNALLEEIQNMTKAAKEILSDKGLITALEGDEIWEKAENALTAFDGIVFLKEAMLHYLKNSVNAEILSEDIKEIQIWLLDSEWSPLRLTVLNDLRRNLLERVPDDKKHLFPWYEIFSDYDTNTINILIEKFNLLSDVKKWDGFPEEMQERLPDILDELEKDKVLLQTIKDRYIFQKNLFSALAKKSAFALFWISEENAINYPVDDKVAIAGFLRVSTNLIKKASASLSCEAERIFWLFLSAFCGPELSNAQRMELFKIVEKNINTINITTLSEEKIKVLSLLKEWFNSENVTDTKISEYSFKTWNNLLLTALPEKLTEEVYDEKPEKFREAITYLKDLQIKEPKKLAELLEFLWRKAYKVFLKPEGGIDADRIREEPVFYGPTDTMINAFKTRYLSDAPGLYAEHVRESGEPSETFERVFYNLQNNPIEIRIKPDDNNYYLILPPLRYVENNDLYSNFINEFVNLSEELYCGYSLIPKAGEEAIFKNITFKPVTGITFEKIEKDKYEKAIIAISGDENMVKEIENVLQTSKDIEITTKLNIAVIICIFI
ncbi:MAG: type III-E CRISPR-associated protein Csx30 [Nitrospirota bacterium]